MRNIIIGIIVISIVQLINCNVLADNNEIIDNNKIAGYRCKSGTEVYQKNSKSIKSCELANDEVIYDINFETGTVINGFSSYITSCKIKDKKIVRGYPLQANSNINFYSTGKFWSFVLSEDFIVQNYPCKANKIVEFGIDEKIRSFILSKNAKIFDYTFKADTKIDFGINGNLSSCLLSEDTIIQGCNIKENTEARFHSNSKFYYGLLSENTIIPNIAKCKNNTKIYFDEKGNLDRCILSDIIKFFELVIEEGTDIKFDNNGNPYYFELINDIELSDIRFKKKSHFNIEYRKREYYIHNNQYSNTVIGNIVCNNKNIRFYLENNQLKECVLSDDSTINNIKCMKERNVNFYENGQLKNLILAEDSTISGYKTKKNTSVKFYENSQLYKIQLIEDTIINGIKCKKDTNVYFFEDGQLKYCILDEDTIINGIMNKANSKIQFFKDSKKYNSTFDFKCTCYDENGKQIDCNN